MIRKISFLFLLRFAKIALSVLSLWLSAKYFGTSIWRDVWLLALNGIVVLDAAIWGPLNEIFRTKFIFIREEEGEQQALTKVRSLFFFTCLVSVALVIIVACFRDFFVGVLAPGFDSKELTSLSLMLLVLIPALLLNQVNLLLNSLLNAYHSFVIPDIVAFVGTAVNIILLILLAPVIGIFSLVISYYIGILLLTGLLVWQVFRLKIGLFSNTGPIKFSYFWIFFGFSLPFFYSYFLGQISAVLEKSLASTLGVGMVSMVDYGRKFSEMLITVLLGILMTFLVPSISQHFIRKDYSAFYTDFRKIYQWGLLIITIFVALFSVIPDSIVRFFYNEDSISVVELATISRLSSLYAWGVLVVFLYFVFGMALLSSNNKKKYAYLAVVAQMITIGLNLLLVRHVREIAFPVAYISGHLIGAAFMFIFFPFQIKKLLALTIKYMGMMASVVGILFALDCFLPLGLSDVQLIVLYTCVALFSLVLLSAIFRLDEWKYISRLLKWL
ncbi:lipid II flippase MurJ [Parapedobacter deserti]|uniref:Lipid II flippase MurJ n=1 Tax=Parapedobacter deserti TaxID=1912957 RepID=A0ABV7JV94_9SPHI